MLFDQGHIQDIIEVYRRNARGVLDQINPSNVLERSIEDFVEEFDREYGLYVPELGQPGDLEVGEVDVDVRHDPGRAIFDRSRPVYVKGTSFTISVPFEGNPRLFGYGFGYYLSPIEADITDQALVLRYQAVDPDPKAVKSDLDGRVERIRATLNHTRGPAQEWTTTELPNMVKNVLTKRREKLLKDQDLAKAVGFSLKRREGETYAVPVKRKKIAVRMKSAPVPRKAAKPYEPQPELELEQYEDVLAVLSNMAIAIERNPSAFVDMEEEQLRDILLVMLNSVYEGQASGETFNRGGKTDILIRADGRNVFIGECKIWSGSKALGDAVDQLLGYLCWRDTKGAIVLFSRRKNFTKVLEAIPEAINAHGNCRRQLTDYKAEAGFRFVLSQL